MINTALSSRCGGPHSRFLCRSTMEHVHGILLEHVYGILLDEKFLHRSMHAAFVNTKWYEAWLERTLFLDPIIFDMWIPGVLSWASGQPCNSHHERHTISLACLSFCLDSQDTQIRWLVSCPLRVNLNAVVVQQRRATTRLLCYCPDTGIMPQWPPCACDLLSTVIACVSVFFCVRHSTRTQFLHA